MLALFAVLLGIGCGETPLLDLRVVTPEGADPLAGADQLVLRVVAPSHTARYPIGDGSAFRIESELEVHGEISRIELEAFGGATLLARGESPPLVLRSESDNLALLVGVAGRLSTLSERMPYTANDPMVALLPSWGFLLAGGQGADGHALASYAFYDVFEQRSVAITEELMPEARAGAAVAVCGAGCAVLALGRTLGGLANTLLVFDGSWRSLPDGLDPAQRRERFGAVGLADGSLLLVGGAGADGQPVPGLLRLSHGGGVTPKLALLPQRVVAPRVAPSVARAGDWVLALGGQPAGQEPAELVRLRDAAALPLPWEGPTPEGAATVGLENGLIAVVGGSAPGGEPLADGWLVDPVARTVRHLGPVLAAGRRGHALLRCGDALVVVGGEGASGATVSEVERLSLELRLEEAAVDQRARQGQRAGALGPGTFFIFGGSSAEGLLKTIEVYQTARVGR